MTAPHAASGPARWAAESSVATLLLLLAVNVIVAAIGSAVSITAIDSWYGHLAKPWWTPPDRVFGPIWTLLYAGMAVAAWLVHRAPVGPGKGRARSLYALQLGLNLLWPVLFFGFGAIGLAALEIVALLAAVAATTRAFARHSRAAALLMLPYLAWIAFAATLNLGILWLNG